MLEEGLEGLDGLGGLGLLWKFFRLNPLNFYATYLIAAIPGNSFPSKYSSNAPPPVET